MGLYLIIACLLAMVFAFLYGKQQKTIQTKLRKEVEFYMKHCDRAIFVMAIILALTLCGCRAGGANTEISAQQGISATEPEGIPSQAVESSQDPVPETTPAVQTERPAPQETVVPSAPFAETVPAQIPPDEEPGLEELQKLAFAEILTGDGEFFSHSYQQQLSISGYLSAFAAETGVEPAVTKYAVVDTDDDGTSELLLWITVNEYTDYGTLLLRLQNEQVEEYTFAYRQLFELKNDGSFACSGDATGSGYAKLVFDEDGWQYREIPDENQEMKTDAQWYSYPGVDYSEVIASK